MVWRESEEIIDGSVSGNGKKRQAPSGRNSQQSAVGAGQPDWAERRGGWHARDHDSASVPDARLTTYRASASRVRTCLVHRRPGEEAGDAGGSRLVLRSG